jgi:hypothetical protein
MSRNNRPADPPAVITPSATETPDAQQALVDPPEVSEADAAAAEQAEKDKAAAEQAEKDKAAAEQAEKDKAAAEQAEKDKAAAETSKKKPMADPPKVETLVERAKVGEVYSNATLGMVSVRGLMFPPGEEHKLTVEDLSNDAVATRIPQAVKNGLLRKV